jgi:hypothetical protein
VIDVVAPRAGRGGHGPGDRAAGADGGDAGLLGLGGVRLVVEERVDGRALFVEGADPRAATEGSEVERVVGVEAGFVVAPHRAR